MSESQTSEMQHNIILTESLVRLSPTQIRRVDEALVRVGDFGEVRLVVTKGRLRFIQVLQSESAQGNSVRD